MNFILTADAREINLDFPRFQQLRPMTIAWSLSQINRFNGHAARPYSVAEHSLLVCEILEREMRLDVHGLLAGLMHDAHECIASDLPSPAKRVIGLAWIEWETRWESLVRSTFGLHTAASAFREQIRQADLMALATERRDLMPHHERLTPWPVLKGIEPVTWVCLDDQARRRMNWEDWRDRFLDRFQELEFARSEGIEHPSRAI